MRLVLFPFFCSWRCLEANRMGVADKHDRSAWFWPATFLSGQADRPSRRILRALNAENRVVGRCYQVNIHVILRPLRLNPLYS